MKKAFSVVLFWAVFFAYSPGAQLYISFNDSVPVLYDVIVGYVYKVDYPNLSGEYELSIILNNTTLYKTRFDRPQDIFCYDTETSGGCEIVEIPFAVVVPFKHHSQIVEVKKGDEVLFSEPLSRYVCRENGRCEEGEDYLSCPLDCRSGGKDDFCDRMEDGICDPDCISSADLDCEKKEDKIPTIQDARKKLNITVEKCQNCRDEDLMTEVYIPFCFQTFLFILFLALLLFAAWYVYKRFRK